MMCFFPEPFIAIFTSDVKLVALASYAIKRIFAAAYIIGLIFVGSTIFQALGKAVQSFITSISRATLFLIPLIFTLPRFFQLDGIWWAFPLADMLTFLLTLLMVMPQIRQLRHESDQRHEYSGMPVTSF
jgi:Na+-driven multidrug efflux pump